MDPSKPAVAAATSSQVNQLLELVNQLQELVKQLQVEVNNQTREIYALKKAGQDHASQLALQQKAIQDLTAHLSAQPSSSPIPVAQATALPMERSRIKPKEEHIAVCSCPNYHCEHCGKLLELNDWFRCHECEDCNFCRACFETESSRHANASHTFSDMSALPRVFNRRTEQYKALQSVASHNCDRCKKSVYPYKGEWFRCNKCRSFELCGDCWETGHVAHKENRHTFTDMSTVLRNTCGFPAIENKKWDDSSLKTLEKCSGCKKKLIGSRFFHCNQCISPQCNLCEECMVSTDLWRTHSSMEGAAHTFTKLGRAM